MWTNHNNHEIGITQSQQHMDIYMYMSSYSSWLLYGWVTERYKASIKYSTRCPSSYQADRNNYRLCTQNVSFFSERQCEVVLLLNVCEQLKRVDIKSMEVCLTSQSITVSQDVLGWMLLKSIDIIPNVTSKY